MPFSHASYTFLLLIVPVIAKTSENREDVGAGTILEALTLNKPLVVVINDQLANNHQTELATQLESDQHLIATNCSSLLETVKNLDTSNLRPYQPGDPQLFGQFLNKTMGVG